MKYMGSKARIAKYLKPFFTSATASGGTYWEPFVGGGNMIDKLEGYRIGSDSNKYVIALLSALRDGWQPPEFVSRDLYKKVKASPEDFDPFFVGWVGVGCSYSGKWFGGFAGKTKTKKGTVRDYQSEARRNVLKQAPNLKECDFMRGDYEAVAARLDPKGPLVIYCDIPYKNTTGYAEGFDHDKFYLWCKSRVAKGDTVFVSEYSMPSGFRMLWEKPVKSSLSANGKGGGSKSSVERLFICEVSS